MVLKCVIPVWEFLSSNIMNYLRLQKYLLAKRVLTFNLRPLVP